MPRDFISLSRSTSSLSILNLSDNLCSVSVIVAITKPSGPSKTDLKPPLVNGCLLMVSIGGRFLTASAIALSSMSTNALALAVSMSVSSCLKLSDLNFLRASRLAGSSAALANLKSFNRIFPSSFTSNFISSNASSGCASNLDLIFSASDMLFSFNLEMCSGL